MPAPSKVTVTTTAGLTRVIEKYTRSRKPELLSDTNSDLRLRWTWTAVSHRSLLSVHSFLPSNRSGGVESDATQTVRRSLFRAASTDCIVRDTINRQAADLPFHLPPNGEPFVKHLWNDLPCANAKATGVADCLDLRKAESLSFW